MPPPLPLARRTRDGLVVDARTARIACRWTGLASRDGERVDVEWTGHVACVDTPADRALLAERFSDDSIDAARVVRLLVDDARYAVAVAVAAGDAQALVSDPSALSAAIEAAARRAGFAAGLRVSPPFATRVESPTLRARGDAERARRLRETIGSADEDPRVALHAAIAADERSSRPTPTLWIAAGTTIVGADPTAPDLSRAAIAVDGIGPLRSLRAATIGGRSLLLAGGRGGVAIVDDGLVTRTFLHAGESEFGFNAMIGLDDQIVASHAEYGIVAWPLDGGPSRRLFERGARQLVAICDRAAAFVGVEGGLFKLRDDGRVDLSLRDDVGAVIDLAAADDGRLVVGDASRRVALIGPGSIVGGDQSVVTAVAAIDVLGLPHAVVADEHGGLTFVDFDAHRSVLVAARWPARAVRARPGFVAMLGVDRQRVGLLDLSRADAEIVELNIHAALSRRAADICFA